MSYSTISFEESRQFSKIILDYVNGHENIAPYYNLKPEISSYKQMMEQKNYNNNFRPILVEQLRKQYQDAAISFKKKDPVALNIDALLAENTYTITTGHQLCIFTGPLYFIFKIQTTIQWCRALKEAHPDKNFVPIFWMASEDHDFAEVNHVYINKQKFTWDIDSKEQPVGKISTQGFENFAAQIQSLATNDYAQKQLQEFISFYSTSENLSQATRKLVHTLFGHEGLVILDADNHELKKLFIPYIQGDILEQHNFKTLNKTNLDLKQHYKTTVNGRNINFFYLSKVGRKLITQNNDRYEVEDAGLYFTKAEIEAEINNKPEMFSPNVIMRPLYQEVILPNLSYIGGPGEIAYWLQLKDIFKENKVSFPILTLRNFVMLIKEQHFNQLSKIGVSPADLFKEDIEIERLLVSLNHDGGQKIIIDDFDNYLQQIISIAEKTDNTISSELLQYKRTWKSLLEKQHHKLDKQQRKKVASQIEKALTIKHQYFVNKVMQERYFNILSYGITMSIPQLLKQINAATGIKSGYIQLPVLTI